MTDLDQVEDDDDQDAFLVDPVRVAARFTPPQAEALYRLMALLTHDACYRLGMTVGETVLALEAFDRLRRNLHKRGFPAKGQD